MTRAGLTCSFPNVLTMKPSPGARIREARRALGLSQRTFASRLGTTRRRVIAWEGDANAPSALYLQRIAAVTGRSVDFFLDGVDAAGDDEEADAPLSRTEIDIYQALRDRVERRLLHAAEEVAAR